MIYYILGIITGLLIDIYRPSIARSLRQVDSKIKKKGSILEPESDELSEWVKGLPTE